MANESFYTDRWTDMEDAARGLEQTARFLPRAEDVPPSHKETLPRVSKQLGAEALKLREAALTKNVKEGTAVMQRINLAVRELRLAP